jgi:L-2-hydroxyglutarate oxidase LhgO
MTRATPDIETIVIGGGIIGLAIAYACTKAGYETCVFERCDAIDQGTSGRSSEVIHAGLYYPPQSLKARMCVEGKELLYAYARDRNIAFRKPGKLVVATSVADMQTLDTIAKTAKANGVDDLLILDADGIRTLEPNISGIKALFSPSTGIIDSHGLMRALETDITDRGGTIVLRTEVRNVTRCTNGLFEIELISAGDVTKITARYVFAAAGLGMAEIGARLPSSDSYVPPPLCFAKAHYFALRRKSQFRHLVYPVPADGGLGIHLTLDLEGNVRFGPDVQWVDRIDHAFDDNGGLRLRDFEHSIRRYWPGLPDDALTPSYAGIRPKTSGRGEPAQDFTIHGPRDHGIPHLIALYGIESPGLTSSLAIARHCVTFMRDEVVDAFRPLDD